MITDKCCNSFENQFLLESFGVFFLAPALDKIMASVKLLLKSNQTVIITASCHAIGVRGRDIFFIHSPFIQQEIRIWHKVGCFAHLSTALLYFELKSHEKELIWASTSVGDLQMFASKCPGKYTECASKCLRLSVFIWGHCVILTKRQSSEYGWSCNYELFKIWTAQDHLF